MYNLTYLERYKNVPLCSPLAVDLMENNLCCPYQLLGSVDGIGLFCTSFMAYCDVCATLDPELMCTNDITQNAAANLDLLVPIEC